MGVLVPTSQAHRDFGWADEVNLELCRGACVAKFCGGGRGFRLALRRPVQKPILNSAFIWILPYNDFHSSMYRNSPCCLPERLQFLDTISMEEESV